MPSDKNAIASLVPWILPILLLSALGAVAQAPPLTIKTDSFPVGVAGASYEVRFIGDGGRQPYAWKIRDGDLPPGLQLDEKSGVLTGVPTTAGEYVFTVELADSSVPRNAVERKYTLIITAAMTVQWIDPPRIVGEAIRGRLEVSNQTSRPFDLTVIVLAVNEVGKAFALGYQHFTLAPRLKSPPIPFESTLPFGTYVVHADAVAEVQAINTIYRARMQTDQMAIKQP
jgi:hypothetical protein